VPRRPAATAGRRVRCTGWAWPFPDQRLRSVEMLIDGEPAGAARLTLRPDVADALAIPEAALSGFEAEVELPPDPGDGGTTHLSALARGLAGASWSVPGQLVPLAVEELPLDPSSSARGGDAASAAVPVEAPRSAGPEGADRALRRRRLGYDPWHTVVLIEGQDAPRAGGSAIAALDAIAERHPTLELLIAGVAPEGVLSDLLRRTIVATGLADRVTVPSSDEPAHCWRAIADVRIDASNAVDLAAMIEQLAAAAERRPHDG
jgi:hypothetical protein